MKQCLVDINVLIAILVDTHPLRQPALAWWNRQPAGGAGLCRLVQLGVVRLLANPRVMERAVITAQQAWELTRQLLADERLEFWTEPAGFEHQFPKLLRYAVPTPALVTDAYLAAFALSRGVGVATFDRGFQQFEGLRLELIGAQG